MDFLEYSSKAIRTSNKNLDWKDTLVNGLLGLNGEVGELTDSIKKNLFHGNALDLEACKKELGDILWYLNSVADTLGFDLEEIAEANIAKLAKRYKQGFSTEASQQRVDML